MTKKKLTKKQKQQMLYNATMIAEGAMDETSEMSYIQAWQWLVDTGEVWKLQGWFQRAAHRMLSEGTLQPAPLEEETPNNEDEQ
mgnify:CR=1 FL=1